MKHLLILACVLLWGTANAQKSYTTSKDEETGAKVFKGPITFSDLSEEPSFTWLKKGEASYTPDSNAIALLQRELTGYSIVTVMGTWCDDSQNLIPKLHKVLVRAGFPMKQFVMYGADRAKQTGGVESRIYEIKKVPTIILFKDNREIGRITESVTRSVETDLAQMIAVNSGHN